MASFDDLASGYASRIRAALRTDGFVKSASVTRPEVRTSQLLRTLKAVHDEIDGLVYPFTEKPLSEADKQEILRKAAEKLGLPSPRALSESVKAASNDALDDLIVHIDNLLQGKGK